MTPACRNYGQPSDRSKVSPSFEPLEVLQPTHGNRWSLNKKSQPNGDVTLKSVIVMHHVLRILSHWIACFDVEAFVDNRVLFLTVAECLLPGDVLPS